MFNYLLIEKDLDKFKYLLNTISDFDSDLRLYYIADIGKESLDVIKSHDIDFILFDLNITDINYLEILDYIEKEKVYKNSVIIISNKKVLSTHVNTFSCISTIIEDIHNKTALKEAVSKIILDKKE